MARRPMPWRRIRISLLTSSGPSSKGGRALKRVFNVPSLPVQPFSGSDFPDKAFFPVAPFRVQEIAAFEKKGNFPVPLFEAYYAFGPVQLKPHQEAEEI